MRVDLSNYKIEETSPEQRRAFSLEVTKKNLAAWTAAAKEFASGARRFLSFVQDLVQARFLLEQKTIASEAPDALYMLSMGLDIAAASSNNVSIVENLLLSHKETINQQTANFSFLDELVQYSGSLLDMAKRHGLLVDKISKTAIRNKMLSLRKERNLVRANQ